MNAVQPVVILSAELERLTDEENAQRTEALQDWLNARKWAYKLVIGAYKGRQELSFVVPADTDGKPSVRDLLNLARAYGQESVLYVDASQYAYLFPVDDPAKIEQLGKFKQVSEAEARSRDAFTYDIAQGVYYVAG